MFCASAMACTCTTSLPPASSMTPLSTTSNPLTQSAVLWLDTPFKARIMLSILWVIAMCDLWRQRRKVMRLYQYLRSTRLLSLVLRSRESRFDGRFDGLRIKHARRFTNLIGSLMSIALFAPQPPWHPFHGCGICTTSHYGSSTPLPLHMGQFEHTTSSMNLCISMHRKRD